MQVIGVCCTLPVITATSQPRVGSRVVRIDTLVSWPDFIKGRLNQALSVLSLSLDFF